MASLLLVSLVLLGGFLVVGGINYLILRVSVELAIGPVILLGNLLTLALVIAAWAYSIGVLIRTWHSVAREAEVDLAGVLTPTSSMQTVAIVLLLAPFSVLPLTTGFVVAAAYYAIAGRMGPVAGFSEGLERTTRSARAFFHTILIGFVAWVLGVAILWVITLLISLTNASAVVDLVVSDFDSFETRDDTAATGVLGGLFIIAFALPALFCLFHVVGLWTVGWARELVGRQAGTAVRQPN